MKKLILLFLLLMTTLSFSQQWSSNWGERILFGTRFAKIGGVTDSTRLTKASLRDTVLADTLYSGVLEINENTEGIYNLAAFFTNVGGTTDSIRIDMRLVTIFRDNNATPKSATVKFGSWKHLKSSMASGSLQELFLSQADSSWWTPHNGRQYRMYDTATSTDTCTHLVTDYIK